MNIIVIPARLESKRLLNKPLITVQGKTILQWTYEAASQVSNAHKVVVAIPEGCGPLIKHCLGNGIPYIETTKDLENGTRRCYEAVKKLFNAGELEIPDFHADSVNVVNWQVDEPLVKPKFVETALRTLWGDDIWTFASAMIHGDLGRSSVVKVIRDEFTRKCYWFSRAPMAGALNHVGIYIYKWPILQYIERFPNYSYAVKENLEQLNWIGLGFTIRAHLLESECFGINTQKDLDDFRDIKSQGIKD